MKYNTRKAGGAGVTAVERSDFHAACYEIASIRSQ